MAFVDLLLAVTRLLDVHGFCNLIFILALVSFLVLHWPLWQRFRQLTKDVTTAADPDALRQAVLQGVMPLAANLQVETHPLEWLRGDLVADAAGRRKLAAAIPGIITALGILGTFLGLVLGLVSFDVSDSATLRESIRQMMLGIRLAFLTSITAIAASIIWNFLDRLLLQYYSSKAMILRRNAADQFPELLTTADGDSDGSGTTSAIREGLADIAETVREALRPELDRLMQMNQELRDSQAEAVKALGAIPARAADAAALLDRAGQSLVRAAERTEEAVRETARVSEGLHEASERLLRTSEHVSRIQADIQSWSEAVTDRMARAAEGLDAAGGGIQRMADESRRHGDETRRQLQELSRTLREAAEGFRGDAGRSLQEALDTLDAGLADMTGHLSGSLQEVRDTVGELPGILHELRDIFGGSDR